MTKRRALLQRKDHIKTFVFSKEENGDFDDADFDDDFDDDEWWCPCAL